MLEVEDHRLGPNSFKVICPRSKRQMLLICVNPDCTNCAFVCPVDDGCASVHRHQQINLELWSRYEVQLRLVLAAEANSDRPAEDVPDQLAQLFNQSSQLKQRYLQLAKQARLRTSEGFGYGISQTLKAIRQRRFADTTGMDMRRLIRLLEGEVKKENEITGLRESEKAKDLLEVEELLEYSKSSRLVNPPFKDASNLWKWTTVVLVILLLISSARHNPNQEKQTHCEKLQTPTENMFRNLSNHQLSHSCLVEDMDSGQLSRRDNLSCRLNSTGGVLICVEKKDIDTFQSPEERAQLLINQQQYQEAINVLSHAALVSNISTAPQCYLRAKAFIQLGKFDSALLDLEKAVRLHPQNVRYFEQQAFVLRKLDRYNEAITALDKAIKLEPANGKLYRDKGIALYKQSKFSDSIKLLELSLNMQESPHLTYFYLSMAYHTLFKFAKALENVDRAIAIKSEVADYHIRRAMILTGLGRKVEAVESNARAASIKQ